MLPAPAGADFKAIVETTKMMTNAQLKYRCFIIGVRPCPKIHRVTADSGSFPYLSIA